MASLTEQIRQALSKRDGVSEDVMRTLSQAYSAEADAVNERLSQAAALLHKGLRSEAIQLASLNPNAIDAAAALDFPEFDDWCEILMFYGIAPPNELQRDLVDQLSEAIVESQPLEGYLRQHRRLAIARAPLAWRIKTLRQIADLDPGNAIWETDLETWEAARLQQVEAEVRNAIRDQNVDALRQLHDELSSDQWRIKPSATIVKPLAQALDQHKQKLLGEQLSRHAAALHEAFCQFDEDGARKAAAAWTSARGLYRGETAADLLEQAEPALDWLRQMDEEAATAAERSAAVGRLQSSLDTHVSRRQLEAAFNACSMFDEPPPEQLIRRYREAIHQHQVSATRRNQTIVAAILSLTAITIGMIVYWQISANHRAKVQMAATNLTNLLDTKRLTEAQSLWSQLQRDLPKVASDVNLATLHSRLQTELASEEQRAVAFADYLAQATVDSPDQMVPTTLTQAERLADTEEEKAAAFKIRRQYNQWDREIATGQTQLLLAAVKQIEDELDSIESMHAADVPLLRLTQLDQDLTQLPAQYTRASNEAVAQARLTQTRANTIHAGVQDMLGKQRAEQAIVDRIKRSASLTELRRNLGIAIRGNSSSQLASELKITADESEFWSAIEDWNAYVRKLGSSLAKPMPVGAAQDLDGQFIVLQGRLKENPAAEKIRPAVDKVERYRERSEILANHLGSLRQSVISDLVTVVTSPAADGQPGNRYFVYKNYHDQHLSWFGENSTSRRLDVVVNTGGAIEQSGLLDGPLLAHREPYSTIEMLANIPRLSNGTFEIDWERNLLGTIGQIRSRSGLDWRLKEMLIQHVLDAAIQGSESLSTEAGEPMRFLRSRSGERENWFYGQPLDDRLPDAVESQVISPLAALHRNSPSAKDIGSQIARYQFQWLGYFISTPRAAVDAHQVVDTVGNGHVFTVSITDTVPQQLAFARVGSVRDGILTMDHRRADIRAGMPIFFLNQ